MSRHYCPFIFRTILWLLPIIHLLSSMPSQAALSSKNSYVDLTSMSLEDLINIEVT
jgi:hypothetical protein